MITSTKFEYFIADPVFAMNDRTVNSMYLLFKCNFFQLSPLAEHYSVVSTLVINKRHFISTIAKLPLIDFNHVITKAWVLVANEGILHLFSAAVKLFFATVLDFLRSMVAKN